MTDDGSASRPQYPQPASAQQYAGGPPPATGALPYALGFLAYIPIPIVNFVVAGVVMAAVYPWQRRRGGVAAENGRRAANWGLTLIVMLVALFGATFALVPVLADTDRPFVVSPLLLLLSLGLAHLIVLITGLVRANRGEVFENRIAIPFFRRR